MVEKTRIVSLALAAIILALAAALCISAPAAFAEDPSAGGAKPAAQPALGLTVSADSAAPAASADAPATIRYRTKSHGTRWQSITADNAISGTPSNPNYVTGLRISLGKGMKGKVLYRALPWWGSWTGWKSNGASLTSSNGFEAVQIKLAGAVAKKYDVVYRVNLEYIGWQRRMRNGESTGVVSQQGTSWIRAIKVALVPKEKASGWVGSGAWSQYLRNGKPITGRWITTAESPIDDKLGSESGKRRYWLDADGYLAVGRVIDPKSQQDAAARHLYYVTEYGYPAYGIYSTPKGLAPTTKSGRLYTSSRWLVRKNADGKKCRYRLKKAGSYAVLRTGMFKIDGKRYYAWRDTGEIMRSKSWWIGNSWYTADKNGVLTKSNNKKLQHIERYVKWALSIARNNSHGYSQINRWGPDYDCSSFVVSALKNAGFRTGDAVWTGNLREELTKYGFRWYTNLNKLRRGDILLVHQDWSQHTEMYIGSSQIVGASSSETGGIDGQTGDQTGLEIRIRGYYNMPWDGFLRYVG